jgi:hypothetical protein
VGEWKDGEKHGQGSYTYPDGGKYEGEWKVGKNHGQGTFTFSDGGKYVGEFKDGNIYSKTVNGKRIVDNRTSKTNTP